jgi:trans-aconitate 2-methyltransferase
LIYATNRWEAQTYDDVSRLVQYQWGRQVLEWRKWKGNESVMDAGCGSGLLTNLLARRVPRGKVYAVDVDPNMIMQVLENVELIQSDIADVNLPTKSDVIFSNAVLHWLHDHTQVFQHFWDLLNCDYTRGRQLLIQCGGYGNLREVLTLLRQVMKLNEFKVHFSKFNQPWYFAKPDDTDKLLWEIGFINTGVHLHNDRVSLTNRDLSAKFVKTVIMKPFLECLPDDEIRNSCLELFLHQVEKRNDRSTTPWSLDYVRLNIIADKP